jgi:hypothetical protein
MIASPRLGKEQKNQYAKIRYDSKKRLEENLNSNTENRARSYSKKKKYSSQSLPSRQ